MTGIPAPARRPTEYVSAALGATLLLIDWFLPLDPELQARIASFVLIAVVPAVTWIVARVRR